MLQLWLVLDNPALLNNVLEGWNDLGVRGITILESTGVHRVRARSSRQDAPFMLGFSRLLRTDQVGHYTLFAVVPTMDVVERLVAKTEEIVGDLSQPNTGVLFAVPLAAAWGLPKQPFNDTPPGSASGSKEESQDGPSSAEDARPDSNSGI
jgi:nitrogen regulatory protein P-II 1